MDASPDIEELEQVFEDHPKLVRLLLDEADWWRLEDGSCQFSVTVEDLDEWESAFHALAAALGQRVVGLRPEAEPPAVPAAAPVRFADLPRTRRD